MGNNKNIKTSNCWPHRKTDGFCQLCLEQKTRKCLSSFCHIILPLCDIGIAAFFSKAIVPFAKSYLPCYLFFLSSLSRHVPSRISAPPYIPLPLNSIVGKTCITCHSHHTPINIVGSCCFYLYVWSSNHHENTVKPLRCSLFKPNMS